MMRGPSILCLRERFSWMGVHSGYDVLCKHLSSSSQVKFRSVFRERKPVGRAFTGFSKPLHNKAYGSVLYDASSLKAELKVFAKALLWRPDIIHVMYLEENYGLLRHVRRITGAKLVATAHHPPAWLETGIHAPQTLGKLDAVLVMAKSQIPYFEKYCSCEVAFTPHGVDVEYFSPRPELRNDAEQHVVFCGAWLRDIDALKQAVEVVATQENARIIWDVIVPEWARQRVVDLLHDSKHVCWHTNVSDEELRGLYQSASVAFIPLLDCTANNAVLECMACAVPVVTTRVGGIPDYVTDQCGAVLEPGDHAGLVRALCALLENKGLREAAGRNARLQAESLSWANTAAMTLDVYRRVLEER